MTPGPGAPSGPAKTGSRAAEGAPRALPRSPTSPRPRTSGCMSARSTQADGEPGARSVADLTGLLVEFARARKGLSFYEEGHAARVDLIDRAWMAWQFEIQRSGALEIVCDPHGLRAPGMACLPASSTLDELLHALRLRQVESIRLEATVTKNAFAALLELLGRPAEYTLHCGGLGPALATRCDDGITINGATGTRERDALIQTSPRTSLGAGLLVSTRDLRSRRDAADSLEKPELDAEPLLAPAHDEAGETLRLMLVSLDGASEDDAYGQLAARACARATALFERGRLDDAYRTALVLADHAVGEGGRSARQALMADDACKRLCQGGVLDDLIDRACSSDGARSVRASRVLLQLGDGAASRVLHRIMHDDDPGRAGQLRAILTALGESGRTGLERALSEAAPTHAAIAARLCGDGQNPALVPALARCLRRDSPLLRRAAVSALAQIGGREAGDALLNELGRDDPDLVRACGRGLGLLGEDRFVLPLLAALDRAERRGDAALAVDLVRDLGRLGSDRAVPRLAAMLRRRRLLARGPKLELQMRALETLAELPGREARRTVEWTAQQGPRSLRDHARALLTGSRGGDGRPAAE